MEANRMFNYTSLVVSMATCPLRQSAYFLHNFVTLFLGYLVIITTTFIYDSWFSGPHCLFNSNPDQLF